MAVSGNGFFVTQSATGAPDYTRAETLPRITRDSLSLQAGNCCLVISGGGVVNTSAALQPLQVGSGVTIPAVASTTIGSVPISLPARRWRNGSSSSVDIYDRSNVSRSHHFIHKDSGGNLELLGHNTVKRYYRRDGNHHDSRIGTLNSIAPHADLDHYCLCQSVFDSGDGPPHH